MVAYCCAYGCKEKFIKGGSVSFHRVKYNVVDGKLYVAALNGKEDDLQMG
ncbi:unnamed protein product, partial [Larinioides sclopetarius]